MKSVRLNILKNDVAYVAIFNDVENFKKIKTKKIIEFIEWVADRHINRSPLTEDDYDKIAKKFGLETGGQVISADRFVTLFLFTGCELKKSELESDFKQLNFNDDIIKVLLPAFNEIWIKLEPLLKRSRLEALPTLNSLRWRVDVRYASSNYMPKPEALAILRIGTSDRLKKNHVHIEMNLEKLSWLELIIVQIKNELLKAEDLININKSKPNSKNP